MGLLASTRTPNDTACPEDVRGDDPHWTAADTAAHLSALAAQSAPVPAWIDEPTDPPTTRRAQLAELRRLAVQQARWAARRATVLVALTGTEPRAREVSITDPHDGAVRSFDLVDEVVEEVSIALRQSVGTVRRDVALARRLGALPATAAALADGAISPDHAEAVARIADGLPEHLLPPFERRILAKAHSSTPGETAAFARRLRARWDSAGEEARRRRAAGHIDVRIWTEDDGLACLMARLPIVDAARLHAAIEDRARAVPFASDDSMGQRRVAVLVEALCGDGQRPSGPAVGVCVNVTVDAATLLGQADEPASVDLASGGPVPITPAALRDLLADPRVPATLRRLVWDPTTDQLLDRGRTAYRVTGPLRAFLVARDGTCRFPHCTRPAEGCDIDHVDAWDDGGGSDRANLMSLCRRHHVLKTHCEYAGGCSNWGAHRSGAVQAGAGTCGAGIPERR